MAKTLSRSADGASRAFFQSATRSNPGLCSFPTDLNLAQGLRQSDLRLNDLRRKRALFEFGPNEGQFHFRQARKERGR